MRFGLVPIINGYTKITQEYAEAELKKVIRITKSLSHEIIETIPVERILTRPDFIREIPSLVYSQRIDALIFVLLTDKVERFFEELIEKLHIPVIIVPASGYNALSAALEIMGEHKRYVVPLTMAYGENEEHLKKDLSVKIISVETLLSLRRTRIGLIGFPAPWLISYISEPSLISKTLGITLLQISLGEFIREIANVTDINQIKEIIESIKKLGKFDVEPKKTTLEMTAKIFIAMKKILERYQVDAIAIRDVEFPEMLHNTVYLPLALLNKQGIATVAEGDIYAILGMIILYKLSNQMPIIGKISKIITSENKLVISYEYAPPQLLKNRVVVSSQFFGGGLSLKGEIKEEGLVTAIRIGGKQCDKITIIQGIIKPSEQYDPTLPPLQFSVKVNGNVKRLFEYGIGGNLTFSFGDFVPHIEDLAKMLNVKIIRI